MHQHSFKLTGFSGYIDPCPPTIYDCIGEDTKIFIESARDNRGLDLGPTRDDIGLDLGPTRVGGRALNVDFCYSGNFEAKCVDANDDGSPDP